ncbi:MAG: hypothetical protein OXC46_01970 [Thaumarchaeota archaeon]|nr:hypothetical protein [Nitrososphaerota archaeon]
MYLVGSFPNSELGWVKAIKEFTVSTIPNTARVTIYYASKPILKMLKNPKRLKFVIKDKHVEIKDKIAKAPNLVKSLYIVVISVLEPSGPSALGNQGLM